MNMIQKCATGFAAVLLSSAALLDTANADPSSVNVASAGQILRLDHSQIKDVASASTVDMTF